MKMIKLNNLKKDIRKNIFYLIFPLVVTLFFSSILFFKTKNDIRTITVKSFNYNYKFIKNIETHLQLNLKDIISVDDFRINIFSIIKKTIKNHKSLDEFRFISNIKNILFDEKEDFKLRRLAKPLESTLLPSRVFPVQNFSYLKKYNEKNEILIMFYNAGYNLYVSHFFFLNEKKIDSELINNLEKDLLKIEEDIIDSLIILINKKRAKLNSIINEIDNIKDYDESLNIKKNSKKEIYYTFNIEKIKKSKLLKDILYFDLSKKKIQNETPLVIYYGKDYSKFYKVLIGGFILSFIIFLSRIFFISFKIFK